MRPQAIGAVNNADLARARAAIEREIAENRLTVVRVVIDANRTVVGEYRRTVRYPRGPHTSGSHSGGETP